MDSFNKVISFVLGLVVVVVFLAIISGKINIGKKIIGLKTVLTPTPTTTQKTPSAQKTTVPVATNNQYNKQAPKAIPATGLPTIVLPLLFSALSGGIYLRKKS